MEAGTNVGFSNFVSIEKLYEAKETSLRDNTLQISVHLQIFGEYYHTSTALLPPELNKSVNTLDILLADFGELYNARKYADVEIACGTETFYAHRVVLRGKFINISQCGLSKSI